MLRFVRRILTFLFFLAPAGVALSGIYLNRPAFAWASSVIILVYAIWQWMLHYGDSSELAFAGEHVYFLGYLCTMVAFLALVLRLEAQDSPDDLRSAVLLMGGVALSTTVAGLIGMAVLREASRARYGSGTDKASYARQVVEVKLTGEIPESLERLRTAATQTGQCIEELIGQLRGMKDSATAFDGALQQGSKLTTAFGVEVNRACRAFHEYISYVESKAEMESKIRSALEKLYDACNAAKHTAGELGEQIGQVTKETAGFNQALRRGDERLVSFVRSVSEISGSVAQVKQVLDDFVELLKLKLDGYMQAR